MSYVDQLISEFQSSGLIIDTNLLLLLIVGNYDKRKITEFKRTHEYTKKDFKLLEDFSSHFTLVITPNIITELTNLSSTFNKQSDFELFTIVQNFVDRVTEYHIDCKTITSESYFLRFGLTDSTIYQLSEEGFLVLTDDLPLFGFLSTQGQYVLNFNHIRSQYILETNQAP